jgi:hypothetical protein
MGFVKELKVGLWKGEGVLGEVTIEKEKKKGKEEAEHIIINLHTGSISGSFSPHP